jgi:hypothetical protein
MILPFSLSKPQKNDGFFVMVNNSLNRKEREERKELKRKTLRPLRALR